MLHSRTEFEVHAAFEVPVTGFVSWTHQESDGILAATGVKVQIRQRTSWPGRKLTLHGPWSGMEQAVRLAHEVIATQAAPRVVSHDDFGPRNEPGISYRRGLGDGGWGSLDGHRSSDKHERYYDAWGSPSDQHWPYPESRIAPSSGNGNRTRTGKGFGNGSEGKNSGSSGGHGHWLRCSTRHPHNWHHSSRAMSTIGEKSTTGSSTTGGSATGGSTVASSTIAGSSTTAGSTTFTHYEWNSGSICEQDHMPNLQDGKKDAGSDNEEIYKEVKAEPDNDMQGEKHVDVQASPSDADLNAPLQVMHVEEPGKPVNRDDVGEIIQNRDQIEACWAMVDTRPALYTMEADRIVTTPKQKFFNMEMCDEHGSQPMGDAEEATSQHAPLRGAPGLTVNLQ